MPRALLGKKIGMSALFSPGGERLPVTILQVGPCVVTQVKTRETDGYSALQVGFLEKRLSRVSKPLQGHLKKAGEKGFAVVREINIGDSSAYELGHTLKVEDVFQVGQSVDVSGVSKGRGFAGVVKRWGFRGGKGTHGSMFHRAPGSIGASASPSKVIKGRKLPGHYGGRRFTVRNLEIIDIRPEEALLIVRGAVPGSASGIVEVRKPKIMRKRR